MPVVKSLVRSSSLPGISPARRGALSGQSDIGFAGLSQRGAPCSHRVVSSAPELVRGVWHCVHIATPSTMYLPRVTAFASALMRFGPFSPVGVCVQAEALRLTIKRNWSRRVSTLRQTLKFLFVFISGPTFLGGSVDMVQATPIKQKRRHSAAKAG